MVSNWLMLVVVIMLAVSMLVGNLIPAVILAFIVGFESGDRLPEEYRKVLTTKVA